VARKGIEQSIELVHRLEREACLVISHAAGDEEREYEKRVRTYSEMLGVNTLFVSGRMNDHRGRDEEGRKIYALSDVYPHADLVTYPSHTEGFGNAFLETIYFRRPIVVNVYSVYAIDIKPKGFRAIELQQYVTDETIRQTREVLENGDLREEMVETNYELARRHYAYGILADKLKGLMAEALGR
jgi:glycosyltransferase involved in cell wall biosynthesis